MTPRLSGAQQRGVHGRVLTWVRRAASQAKAQESSSSSTAASGVPSSGWGRAAAPRSSARSTSSAAHASGGSRPSWLAAGTAAAAACAPPTTAAPSSASGTGAASSSAPSAAPSPGPTSRTKRDGRARCSALSSSRRLRAACLAAVSRVSQARGAPRASSRCTAPRCGTSATLHSRSSSPCCARSALASAAAESPGSQASRRQHTSCAWVQGTGSGEEQAWAVQVHSIAHARRRLQRHAQPQGPTSLPASAAGTMLGTSL